MTTDPRSSRRLAALRVLGTAAALALGASLAGCRTWSEVDYAKEFPANAKILETINIQVVREGTFIALTNTTANAIPPSTLWLNKWFSRPVDRIEVGQTVRFNLRDFRDLYSEPFRAGGFWATDQGDPLVSAHIDWGTGLVGLIVVNRRGG
jgi:hypothetical protein